MTQDYRKRAEDFVDECVDIHDDWPDLAKQVMRSDLTKLLQKVAQEARREENESVLKLIKRKIRDRSGPGGACTETQQRSIEVCNSLRELAKSIRSRMEGK